MPVRTNAPIRLWLALAAALLVGVCAAAALRAAEAPIVDETAVTAADLDAAQVRLDKADGLDAPIKEQAGKLIAQARLNLEAAQAKDRDTAAFKAAADGAPARLVQAKQEFEAAAGERPLAVSADSPLAAWDTEWETVKKEQEESQRELETLIAERKNRDKLKASIPTQLKPPVEERLREVQDQLAAAPPADEAPILTEAKRFELRSRRMLAQAELMMFDTQRASYLAREELIVARQDLVERRMVQLSAYVKRVQEGRQHRAEVEATQDTARQRAAARDAHPQLVETAKRNTDLTALRADLVKRTGRLQQALGEQQETLDALATELDDLREQEDKIGLTKALGELLRQRRPTLDGVLDYGIVGRVFTDAKPEDRTPRASDYRTLRRQIQEKFRALQFDRIPYEGERRSLTKDMAGAVRTLMDRVTTRLPEEVALQIEDEARKLLTGRRDILADLTRDYDTQFELLVELDSAVLELAEKTEEFQVYVDERVLWVRSTTTGPREAVTDALPALVWLLRPANWLEVASALWRDLLSNALFAPLALVLVVLFLVRARLHRRLHAISQRVASPRSDRFSLTLAALALTLAIALPWPLLVRLIAWRLGAQTGTSEFVKAVGVALAAVSAIWMLLAATRAFCLPGGIADAHFHWRGPGLRPLRRNVLVLLAIVAPLVFLIVLFAAQGRTEWHNSVGRIAFVAAQLALAWFMASALRPHGDLVRGMLERRRGGWLDRLRYIWYGSVMLLPVALALLAASGWYYTAQKLYLRFQSSILLFVFTLVISAGCTRGLFVLRRRMALQKAETRTAEGQDPEKDEMDIDLSAVSREARRLTTSFTALAIFLGLWLIWSDVFPALTFMDRPLWTSTAKVAVETAEGTSTVVEQPQAVTIADMALGIVIVIMTLIAGKNLPGLLRLTILQRLPLERGVLFALTAISRYAITATGLVIAFGAIGISWASVQWLVAAATVGLGFGLQEIFANFVSGLIILFERPMRVGDTVTVGSVTGIVTRIRIRATTITDWDRKELIVPNKEFVTGQLVNWTLSDSILRVVVPVGVSYGTDVDLACQTMLRVARENPLVMRDPAPSVLFRQFGDSSLNFDLRAYVADFESYLPVLNDLHMCITKAFRQAGIEIPFPQRDLHVRSVSYDLPVRIQRGPGGTEDAGETTGGG